jgi:hypothetical protein
VNQVLDVIGKGAAQQSWQLDNRGKTMAADKFDFRRGRTGCVDFAGTDEAKRTSLACLSPRWLTSVLRGSKPWVVSAEYPARLLPVNLSNG